MRAIGVAVMAAGWLGSFGAPAGWAQDDDRLPTLKLDRIPAQPAFAGQTRAPAAETTAVSVDVLVEGLATPWALAFLPDGAILINEYPGAMRILEPNGSLSEPLAGLPVISTDGWAGLFDLALDRDFARNATIFFSYTAPGATGQPPNIPRVARAKLDRNGQRLVDVEIVVDGLGGQELLVDTDGMLWVAGSGDVFVGDAQDLGSTTGKLLRLEPDGRPAPGNPFVGTPGRRPEIFSYGHRDISGIALRPGTAEIWITEHGPRGGDELNRIVAGANYGWRVISYGTDYNGAPIGSGRAAANGMEQPRYFWWPSIAPSGLIFYTGSMFPEWRGNALVTALAGQHVSRLVLDGDRVVAEERLLVDRAERIRELRQGPDGALYALTNAESDAPEGGGRLLRIHRPGS